MTVSVSPADEQVAWGGTRRVEDARSRREGIVGLLVRLGELVGGCFGRGSGGGAEGVALPAHAPGCRVFSSLVCDCWRRSVVELERCLALLRGAEPGLYRHLVGRFRLVESRRRRNVRVRGGVWLGLRPNERVLIPDFSPAKPPDRVYEDVLVSSWPSWVDAALVERGLDWLVEHFRGEPELPAEAFAA